MEPSEQPQGGPYLQAAFFCERLLEEADGVLSAIRIVDTVTISGEDETLHRKCRVRTEIAVFATPRARPLSTGTSTAI